ncbi:MAG TPA: hypothetical protein GYA07_10435 [Verrucomicrobia bacterium]|nr:hypothetical protein [Verrucomicrobiota bacterium]
MKKEPSSRFEKAAQQRESGFLSELWSFIRQNKKWWLLPIIIMFLILGGLILLSSTGLAPALYPFF